MIHISEVEVHQPELERMHTDITQNGHPKSDRSRIQRRDFCTFPTELHICKRNAKFRLDLTRTLIHVMRKTEKTEFIEVSSGLIHTHAY